MELYYTDVSILRNEKLIMEMSQHVSKKRADKIDKYIFIKDKALSLGAELLLIHALKNRGIDFLNYEVQYGTKQKPYIKGENVPYYNLSHSEDCAICGTSDYEIGVDVEKRDNYQLNIANECYVKRELEYLKKMNDMKSRRDAFFNLWSAKESFIKAVGTGFDLDPKQFSINIDSDLSVSHNLGDINYNCRFYDAKQHYSMACCYPSQDEAPKKASYVPMSDIINSYSIKK